MEGRLLISGLDMERLACVNKTSTMPSKAFLKVQEKDSGWNATSLTLEKTGQEEDHSSNDLTGWL